MDKRMLVHGDFIFVPRPNEVVVHKDAYLGVEEGRVTAFWPTCPDVGEDVKLVDHAGKLIIPAFSDIHLHAVQYVTRGLGYDKELIPWLNDYTFPEETRYADPAYGEAVFSDLVRELWFSGTLHSVIFSSLHTDTALLLMEMLQKAGLSAYVGKVNMDRNGAETLQETTEESKRETERFLDASRRFAGDGIFPIITPRFAPSCTDELMRWLGGVVETRGLPVQSHVNENRNEIAWVHELFPDVPDYLSVYERFGLLPKGRTIMAHALHNNAHEVGLYRDQDVLLAHCPDSNANLASGIMPAGEYLDRGIRIGLASDIAGGDRLFMGSIMVSAMKASRLLWALTDRAYRSITFAEAFFMATAGGGSFFGRTGAFLPGYAFDALVIEDSRFTRYRPLTPLERLQKFVFLGSGNDIVRRYLGGREILSPPSAASCPFEEA